MTVIGISNSKSNIESENLPTTRYPKLNPDTRSRLSDSQMSYSLSSSIKHKFFVSFQKNASSKLPLAPV